MRIIAGSRKGFRLGPVKGRRVRPTQDRIREAVFNILEQDGPFINVADLFAGTGAMGLEALSRWSGKALFVDADPAVIAGLGENLQRLKLAESGRFLLRDLSRGVGFLKKLGAPFDLIFLDPPYGRNWCLKLVPEILTGKLLEETGTLVLEQDQGDPSPEAVGSWKAADQRHYGRTKITFYRQMERE